MKKVDLTEKRFGKLIANKDVGKNTNGNVLWLCKCDCGRTSIVSNSNLQSGHTKSCGRCQINKYKIDNEIIEGITSTGISFIFDVSDYEEISKYTWFLDNSGYIRATLKSGKRVLLHNLIMKEAKGLFVDHINRNKLDNRKSNLRYVTKQQNCHNRGISKANRSGFKGVSFDKRSKKYEAWIGFNHSNNFIGSYDTSHEAAKAYNQKAIELFGEYAFLNTV